MSEAPVESGPDGIVPAPRRLRRRHFDFVVSFAAIFISAVSLFVAIEHGKTERDLVAANSWPFPRAIVSNGYDAKGGKMGGTIAIGLSNGGVGPAKIKSFELFYRGQPVRSNLDLLRRCCGLGSGAAAVKAALPHGFAYSIADETVLRAGENNPVLKVYRSPEAPEVPNRLDASLLQISFRICYCSVLDQCWKGDLRSTRTTPVDQCPVPEHRFEPNGD